MIERVSIWGEMTQKIYRLILDAYDQGIKEYTSKDVLKWWEAKYGEITDADTERKIISRVHGTGGMTYVRFRGHRKGLIYRGLVEENIDLLRQQLSLKSSEHRTQNLYPTKAELIQDKLKELEEAFKLPANVKAINKLKSLSRDELMNTLICDLPVCTRIKKYLGYDNIYTIGELLEDRTKAELLLVPNFGHKCLTELEYVLGLLGLKIKKSYRDKC